ncbi:MAG: hypothetical protein LBV58_03460 [Acholeplasmatales bacterium]|jgi:hypothetical protein|nr:hypothetical protein [Acholeplasmatales bacterium]
MKKKLMFLLLVLVSVISIVGCQTTKIEIDKDALLASAKSEITVPTEAISDFTVPTSVSVVQNDIIYEVAVAWVSHNAAITINGGSATVTRPGENRPNATGNLDATISFEGTTVTASFPVVVSAVPENAESVVELAREQVVDILATVSATEVTDLSAYQELEIEYHDAIRLVSVSFSTNDLVYLTVEDGVVTPLPYVAAPNVGNPTIFASIFYQGKSANVSRVIPVPKRPDSPLNIEVNGIIEEYLPTFNGNVFEDLFPYLYVAEEDYIISVGLQSIEPSDLLYLEIELLGLTRDELVTYLAQVTGTKTAAFLGEHGYSEKNGWVFKAAEGDDAVLILVRVVVTYWSNLLTVNSESTSFPYTTLGNILGFKITSAELPAYASATYQIQDLTWAFSDGPIGIAELVVKNGGQDSLDAYGEALVEAGFVFDQASFNSNGTVRYYTPDNSIYVLYIDDDEVQNAAGNFVFYIFTWINRVYTGFPTEQIENFFYGYGEDNTIPEFPVVETGSTSFVDYSSSTYIFDVILNDWDQDDIDAYTALLDASETWLPVSIGGRVQYYSEGWLLYVGYDYIAPYTDVIIEFIYYGDYYGPVDEFFELLGLYADLVEVPAPVLPEVTIDSWVDAAVQDDTFFSIDVILFVYSWTEADVEAYIEELLGLGWVRIYFGGGEFFHDGEWLVQVGVDQYGIYDGYLIEVLWSGLIETPVGDYTSFPDGEIETFFDEEGLVVPSYAVPTTTNADLDTFADGVVQYAVVSLYDWFGANLKDYNTVLEATYPTYTYNSFFGAYFDETGEWGYGVRAGSNGIEFIIIHLTAGGTYFDSEAVEAFLGLETGTLETLVPAVLTHDGLIGGNRVSVGDWSDADATAWTTSLVNDYNWVYNDATGLYENVSTDFNINVYVDSFNEYIIQFITTNVAFLFPYTQVSVSLGVTVEWLVANLPFPGNENVATWAAYYSEAYITGFGVAERNAYIAVLVERGFVAVNYGKYASAYSDGTLIVSLDAYATSIYIAIEFDGIGYVAIARHLGITVEEAEEILPAITSHRGTYDASYNEAIIYRFSANKLATYVTLLEEASYTAYAYGKYTNAYTDGTWVISFDTSLLGTGNTNGTLYLSVERYFEPATTFEEVLVTAAGIVGVDPTSLVPTDLVDDELVSAYHVSDTSVGEVLIARIKALVIDDVEVVTAGIESALAGASFSYTLIPGYGFSAWVDATHTVAVDYAVSGQVVSIRIALIVPDLAGTIGATTTFPVEQVSAFLGVDNLFDLIPEISTFNWTPWPTYKPPYFNVELHDWVNADVTAYIALLVEAGAEVVTANANPLLVEYGLNGIKLYFVVSWGVEVYIATFTPGPTPNLFPTDDVNDFLGFDLFTVIPEIVSTAFGYTTIEEDYLDIQLVGWTATTLTNYVASLVDTDFVLLNSNNHFYTYEGYVFWFYKYGSSSYYLTISAIETATFDDLLDLFEFSSPTFEGTVIVLSADWWDLEFFDVVVEWEEVEVLDYISSLLANGYELYDDIYVAGDFSHYVYIDYDAVAGYALIEISVL